MTTPITLLALDEPTLAELRCRYEETTDAAPDSRQRDKGRQHTDRDTHSCVFHYVAPFGP
jgi:hypothetical protein